MTDTEQPSQWAEAEIAAMFIMHGIRNVPSSLVRAFAEREAELAGALEPFAALRLPLRCEGNAAIYSILHKSILDARAALKSREAGHG